MANVWRDPAMRRAQAVRVNGGDGSPYAIAARTPVQPVRHRAQVRAALAGKPVKALPTRRVRTVQRQARRAWHRVSATATAVLIVLVAMLALLPGVPTMASVGVAAALGAFIYTHSK